jgi:thioredoxin-related protein
MTAPRPHPHFNDRQTLDWHTRYADALAAARSRNQRLFIEFGRELCGQCRALVQSVIPRPEIAALLQQGFVALAADCDEPEPEVEALAMQVPDASMLPFVIFADANGRYLDGSSGVVSPRAFETMLKRLLAAPETPS